MPTETVKGGAYKTAEGRWVNANGKPIPEPKDLPSLVDPSEEMPPAAPSSGEEFATPPAPVAAPRPIRTSTKKKSGGD